jgi:predicted Ser/Thr protein kinase
MLAVEPQIGSTIAGYRLEAVLGHGGMSVVYIAEQVRLGRKVALKLLAPRLSADEGFRERFEGEARRAAETEHPNIVPVYDAGEAEGRLYIAMRYVEGRDLRRVIASDGPLSPKRTLFLLEQVAAALDAAHARGLVHRDVKPANILIEDGSERVFVTDFGIAKRVASRGLTRTGDFLGTVDYAAPEQIEGGEVDARTDVYALGCVLYECLSGQRPYERETEVAVMHAHLSQPPPKLTTVRPELTEALDAVIATALAKEKDARYASSSDLVADARAAALGDAPATRPPAAAAPASTSPARRVAPGRKLKVRRAWIWLTAALLALAGIAAGVAALVIGGDSTSKSPSGAERRLLALIPPITRTGCQSIDYGEPSAEASLECSGVRVAVTYNQFSTSEQMNAWYVQQREAEQVGQGTGSCSPRRFRGEGSYTIGGRQVGRYFCFVDKDDGESHLIWSDSRVNVGTTSNVYEGKGSAAAASLMRQWRCCLRLQT